MEYKVTWRYGRKCGTENYNLSSDEEALIVAETEFGLGRIVEETEQMEEDGVEVTFTLEELKKYIDESNTWDCCAFIYSIVNLTKGIVIYKGEE